MGIERGEEWGIAGAVPPDAPRIGTDHELARASAAGVGAVVITGGDIARTLGINPRVSPGKTGHLLPLDVIELQLDDRPAQRASAHVVVGHWLFSRHQLAIMNAAFVADRNLAPRAHPGDGKLDLVTMELAVADRIKARKRQPLGTHVPHPQISIRRVTRHETTFDRPRQIAIDGQSAGTARRLVAEVIPNAITVCL